MTTEYTSEALYTIGDNESCLTALRDLGAEHPDTVIFNRPVNFEWVDVTVTDFLEEVYSVAKGLVANGVEAGDRVIIMSGTRYEWTLLDYAIWAAGAVTVPIYPSSSTSQCEWIVENSGATLAVGENDEHCEKLRNFLEDSDRGGDGHLRRVLSFSGGAIDILVNDGQEAGVSSETIEERITNVKSSDVGSIVYTSGTTGRPKGCRLTHANWLSEARAILTHPVGQGAKVGYKKLTFLPLAHVFARAMSHAAVVGGATQTHWGDMGTLVTEFQRSKPDLIVTVPRIFEKVHAGVKSKATESGGIAAKIFLAAEKTAVEYSKASDTPQGPSALLKARHAIADKLVFSKVREAMGGQLKYAVSGGSALNAQISHFFCGAGIPVYEGYGLTETTAAVCTNFAPDNIIGTVGRPMGGVTIRIAEDGEILVKGSVVFDGYWENDEATKEAFTEDGFYRTGDLGRLLPSGHLKITGRKKEILVTAGGKNVSPGPMEDILRSAPLISQAMVVGDDQKFVGALISLDEEAVKKWKASHDVPENTSIRELAKNPVLRSEIQDAVNEANASVSHAEGIKKFRIVHRDFTEERGEVTPSLKLKRFVVNKNFADDIAWIYKGK